MKKSPKISQIFKCEICDYCTSKNNEYTKHISTRKHQNRTNLNEKSLKISEIFSCKNCNKIYKARNSLWYHEQKCKQNNEPDAKVEYVDNNKESLKRIDSNYDKEFVMMIMKQNQEIIKQNSELQQQMIEVIKNGTHNNTNSHNKTFNLQFFLNETCKNAMNIMDFIESIQLQLSDLEKVGEIGYVDGISNIIVKNLKALDVTQRPLHCTDKKRETLYLKDENKWEKQGEDNSKLKNVIKQVTNKNIRMIPKYKEKHPDCTQSVSKHSDEYNKIILESMGGPGDDQNEKELKIIKNISKEVIVEKEEDNLIRH